MCLAALAAGNPDTRVHGNVERYLLRNLPVIAVLAKCAWACEANRFADGTPGHGRNTQEGVVLARAMHPNFFFFHRTSRFQGCSYGGDLSPAGFFYDSSILTDLTRWGDPTLRTSALVWGCTSPG